MTQTPFFRSFGSMDMLAQTAAAHRREVSVDGSFEKKRIGVLVVAYNAATTLAKVLDRIPADLRPDIEEVIVSDDHSQDSTYLVGLGYQQVSDLPITLIRQPANLGYGG